MIMFLLKFCHSLFTISVKQFPIRGIPKSLGKENGHFIYLNSRRYNNMKITIGQLAKQTGFTVVTIRHYERLGLIHSQRLENGYRSYREEGVVTLNLIKQAKQLGFSLAEVAKFIKLDEQAAKGQDVKILLEKKMIRIEEQIVFLKQLKKTYQELLKSCSGEMPLEHCPIMHKLKYGQ